MPLYHEIINYLCFKMNNCVMYNGFYEIQGEKFHLFLWYINDIFLSSKILPNSGFKSTEKFSDCKAIVLC